MRRIYEIVVLIRDHDTWNLKHALSCILEPLSAEIFRKLEPEYFALYTARLKCSFGFTPRTLADKARGRKLLRSRTVRGRCRYLSGNQRADSSSGGGRGQTVTRDRLTSLKRSRNMTVHRIVAQPDSRLNPILNSFLVKNEAPGRPFPELAEFGSTRSGSQEF